METQSGRKDSSEERISRYLDGELSLEDSAEVAAEIDGNPEAAEVASDLQAASNAILTWVSRDAEKAAGKGEFPTSGDVSGATVSRESQTGANLFCFRCGQGIQGNYRFCPQCGTTVQGDSKREFFPGLPLGNIFNDVRREMWFILSIASGVGAMLSEGHYKQLWLACAICGAKWATERLFLKLANVVRERSFSGEAREKPAASVIGAVAARLAVRVVGPDGLAVLAGLFLLASFNFPSRHESLIIASGLCATGWILLGPSLRAMVKIFRALAEDDPEKLSRIRKELAQIESASQGNVRGLV